MTVDPIIRQIVDRAHVGESNRDIVRRIVRSCKGRGSRERLRTWLSQPRATRHEVIRRAIYQHQQNFILYAAVMGGRL